MNSPDSSPLGGSGRPSRWRKIAILGFAKTVMDAPVHDPSWELWGMNGFWRAAKPDFGIDVPEERWGLWFDVHTLTYTRNYGVHAGIGDKQERWLQQEHPFVIFGAEERPEWPCVKQFPADAVVQKLGRDYFTSTVAYALAYALTLPDVAEVGLWGIDLMHDTEYGDQRPCAEYWIGRAESLGIKVTLHERSALCRQRARYGFEDVNSPLLQELKSALFVQAQGLSEAVEKSKADMERARIQAHTDDGALQVVRSVLARLDVWERGGVIG